MSLTLLELDVLKMIGADSCEPVGGTKVAELTTDELAAVATLKTQDLVRDLKAGRLVITRAGRTVLASPPAPAPEAIPEALKQMPIGTKVRYRPVRDVDEGAFEATTRSFPWLATSGDWLVMLDERIGGYRVHPGHLEVIPETPAAASPPAKLPPPLEWPGADDAAAKEGAAPETTTAQPGPTKDELRAELRAIRRFMGLSAVQMAKALDISAPSLAAFEGGKGGASRTAELVEAARRIKAEHEERAASQVQAVVNEMTQNHEPATDADAGEIPTEEEERRETQERGGIILAWEHGFRHVHYPRETSAWERYGRLALVFEQLRDAANDVPELGPVADQVVPLLHQAKRAAVLASTP